MREWRYRWKKEWKEGEGREGEVKEVRGKRTERVFWERDRETGTEREREKAKQKQGKKEQGEARWEKVKMCFCDPNLPCFPHSPLHGASPPLPLPESGSQTREGCAPKGLRSAGVEATQPGPALTLAVTSLHLWKWPLGRLPGKGLTQFSEP